MTSYSPRSKEEAHCLTSSQHKQGDTTPFSLPHNVHLYPFRDTTWNQQPAVSSPIRGNRATCRAYRSARTWHTSMSLLQEIRVAPRSSTSWELACILLAGTGSEANYRFDVVWFLSFQLKTTYWFSRFTGTMMFAKSSEKVLTVFISMFTWKNACWVSVPSMSHTINTSS